MLNQTWSPGASSPTHETKEEYHPQHIQLLDILCLELCWSSCETIGLLDVCHCM
jgi:hypothetical protein